MKVWGGKTIIAWFQNCNWWWINEGKRLSWMRLDFLLSVISIIDLIAEPFSIVQALSCEHKHGFPCFQWLLLSKVVRQWQAGSIHPNESDIREMHLSPARLSSFFPQALLGFFYCLHFLVNCLDRRCVSHFRFRCMCTFDCDVCHHGLTSFWYHFWSVRGCKWPWL